MREHTAGKKESQRAQVDEPAGASPLPPPPHSTPACFFLWISLQRLSRGKNPYPGQVHLSLYLSKSRGSLIIREM